MTKTIPRFGIRIPPCTDVRSAGEFARTAEDAGFDIAWYPDSQFLWRDVWATLTVAALRTERIKIGSCVTTFETRHPSVTASAIATIEELAPSRTILGLGTGDSAIKTLGLRPTRLRRMRHQIEVVNSLLEGSEVDFGGRGLKLHRIPETRVPIYLAATGPKALQLAGSIADGVIMLAGLAPPLIERAFSRIRDGSEQAGRNFDDLEICVGTFCHITDNPEEAARIAKPVCVGLAQIGAAEQLRLAGIDIEVPTTVEEVYPDMMHAEDWSRASEIAGKWVGDDEGRRYADTFCLVGSVEYCLERIRIAIDQGVTHFYIRGFPSYELPTDLVTAFGSIIIPKVQ